MIRRSLLTASILFVAYQALLPHLPPAFRLTQWGQLSNYRVAQSYLYAPDQARLTVVVGTSLAQRIPAESLGSNFFNLAISGGSTLTGLEILRRCGVNPPMVLVEMNYFYKPMDRDFLGSLFQPGLSTLRQHFSMFRDINRPANYVAGATQWCIDCLRALVHKAQGRPMMAAEPKHHATPMTKVAPEVLALRRRDYEETPATETLQNAAESVAADIRDLQARGCAIVFFEMPVDPELADAKLATEVRRFALQSFPPDRYGWIKMDRQNSYFTRDGIHLETESAEAYGRYLARCAPRDLSSKGTQGPHPGELRFARPN